MDAHREPQSVAKPYEPPLLVVIGTVAELTQGFTHGHFPDGVGFVHGPHTSPIHAST